MDLTFREEAHRLVFTTPGRGLLYQIQMLYDVLDYVTLHLPPDMGQPHPIQNQIKSKATEDYGMIVVNEYLGE